nr:MAG TPA: major outer membrane lipoprotein [Caudoviricetes sp.]
MKRMTLKMMAEDFGKTALNLGRADENKAVRIEIDLSNLLEITPDANASITVETPSGKKYPATTNKEGKLLIWDVNSADTAEEGRGWAQLTIAGSNDEVLKSVVTATRVGRSIRGEGTSPDPVQNWVDDATSKLGNVVSAGENAKEAAEKAEEAAKRANDAAEKAENGGGVQSDYAQNDETQMDYIQNRPGGYYQTVPAIDIQWDGVVGDKPNVDAGGIILVKVSDEILTAEQIIGATVTMVQGSESQSLVLPENAITSGDGFVIVGEAFIISFSRTTVEINGNPLTVPETGTYFAYIEQDGNTMYVSGLTKPEAQNLVPIPGELTNIKGGYDLAGKKEELLNQTVTPEQWNDGNTQVTLKVAMVEGATVIGTAGGVEVRGVVSKNGQYLHVDLMSDENEELYALESNGYLEYRQDTAPTTDVDFALTQTSGVHPKVIPAEYLDTEALETSISNAQTTASNAQDAAAQAKTEANNATYKANQARTAADNAQTTANEAKTAASNAQTTAESAVRPKKDSTEACSYYMRNPYNDEKPVTLYLGRSGGSSLKISVNKNKTPSVKVYMPVYFDEQADLEFIRSAPYPYPRIVGIGGIVMASSTANSTKKFLISVDDSGTLSATEVTS